MTVRHSDAEPRDWLRLYRTDGIGPVHFFRLIERYGTAAAALAALPQIARRAGRPAPVPPSRAAADQELTALRRAGGQLLLASQAAFPPRAARARGRPAADAAGRP